MQSWRRSGVACRGLTAPVMFNAALKRSIKLFLNRLYCMTRIFKTDTVYETLFNCVLVLVFGVAQQKQKYISIPPPAVWRHAGTPAGYWSIFISHSTFSLIMTVLSPADGCSSGQLMPVLVCVRDAGGKSWWEHRQKDSWHLKYGWNAFRCVHVCLILNCCVLCFYITDTSLYKTEVWRLCSVDSKLKTQRYWLVFQLNYSSNEQIWFFCHFLNSYTANVFELSHIFGYNIQVISLSCNLSRFT